MMDKSRAFLRTLGLPGGDLHALPTSEATFPGGAQFGVEIPTVNTFAAAKVFTVGISTPNCAPPGNVASEVGRACRSPPGRPRVRRNALDLSIITASLLVLRDTEKVYRIFPPLKRP